MRIGLLWELAHTKRLDTGCVQGVSYVLTMVRPGTQDGLIHLTETHTAQKLEKNRQFLNGEGKDLSYSLKL